MTETRFGAIQKLNNDNYQLWKFKAELLLIREGWWYTISEDTPTESDDKWKKHDDQARATIGLLVEDNQIIHIREATSAKGAWTALKSYHEKSTLTSKVFILKKICMMRLTDDGDMENHISQMLDLVEKLTALGEKLMDKLVVAMLLCSLPDSYSSLITALESRSEDDLTLSLVKGKLIDEHRRRKNLESIADTSDVAMKTKEHKVFQRKFCTFCKKQGHEKPECRKFSAWKAKKDKEANDRNRASMAVNEVSREFCFRISGGRCDANAWIIDSGATCHMSSDKSFFKQFNTKFESSVRMADGKLAKIEGVGAGTIKCLDCKNQMIEIPVKDVLYVPSLEGNLLSVKKLTNRGFDVCFQGNKCYIKLKDVTMAIGYCQAGLYALKTSHQALMTEHSQGHNDKCIHAWHRRFGHRDPRSVEKLVTHNLVSGIKITKCNVKEFCETCLQGKLARTPFPKQSQTQTKSMLDLIHTDVCGPMQTATPSNKRYMLTITDDYSRYTKIYLMEHKSETVKLIKEFIETMKTEFNKKPKIIRSDRGREYINNKMNDYLKQEGIKAQYTAAYSPEQNGVAERKNRTLMEMARCMLLGANLPNKYWGEAIITATYLYNRLPTRVREKTPYELWFSRKPDVSKLYTFGSTAFAHVPKELRTKLEARSIKRIFIGYSEESKAYRLLDTKTNKVIISRDVKILDGKFTSEDNKTSYDKKKHEKCIMEIKKNDYENTIMEVDYNKNEVIPEFKQSHETRGSEEIDEQNDRSAQVNDEDEAQEYETPNVSIIEVDDDNLNETDLSQTDANSSDPDYSPDKTIEELEVKKSTRATKGHPPERYDPIAKLVKKNVTEPKTIEQALSSAQAAYWKEAMNEEYNSLIKANTWELVNPPTDCNIIGCKWVYKLKRNETGQIVKYRARLVAQGFSQKFGKDFNEVFAPVARQQTFRSLLAIAGKDKLKVHHYDVKAAFLNGTLKETIYMKQPTGFRIEEGYKVCKLHKSIYGLKQAAKIWNETLNEILKKNKFVQSNADPCLYVQQSLQRKIYLLVYVDDLLIASEDETQIKMCENFLKSYFELTDLGPIKHYLGIQIRKNNEGIFLINQRNYIDKILQGHEMQDAKPSKIPLDVGYFKRRDDEKPMISNTQYREIIGALLYVSTNTRPDISASVSILSQRVENPTEHDWNEVKRMLKYLKGTKDFELKLGNKSESTNKLIGYADADWAQDPSTRKSNTGYLFKFNGGTVSWACRKQTCTALSSTEAEYIALSEASQECTWLRKLFQDFGKHQDEPTQIFEDNQSCIKLVENKKFSNRTKHIATKYHHLRELIDEGIIKLHWCPTENMNADMMTKPLGPTRLATLTKMTGLVAHC